VTADVDSETGMLATPNCPKVHSEVFIAGTQPAEACRLHGGAGRTQIAGWEPTAAPAASQEPVVTAQASSPPKRHGTQVIPITPATPSEPQTQEKKGFWHRIGGWFRTKP